VSAFEGGCCLGSPEFREKMVQRVGGKLGQSHSGALRMEGAEAGAGRIRAEELPRLGWSEADLAARRKSAPRKLALAVRAPAVKANKSENRK
jgi:hypothetical protein